MWNPCDHSIVDFRVSVWPMLKMVCMRVCDCSVCCWEPNGHCRSLHCPQYSRQQGKSLLCGLEVVCRSKLCCLLLHSSPLLTGLSFPVSLSLSSQALVHHHPIIISAHAPTFYRPTALHAQHISAYSCIRTTFLIISLEQEPTQDMSWMLHWNVPEPWVICSAHLGRHPERPLVHFPVRYSVIEAYGCWWVGVCVCVVCVL